MQFSLPILLCIHKNPDDHRLINILKQHTDKYELKKYARTIIEESVQSFINSYLQGALEETRKEALELSNEIVAEIKRLGGNTQLESIIEMLKKELKGNEHEIVIQYVTF